MLCNSNIFLQGISNEFFQAHHQSPHIFVINFFLMFSLEKRSLDIDQEYMQVSWKQDAQTKCTVIAIYLCKFVYFLFYSYHLRTYIFGQLFHIHLYGISLSQIHQNYADRDVIYWFFSYLKMVLRVDGINIAIQFQDVDFLNRVVSLYNIRQFLDCFHDM